jgi:hypothetical protein
LPAFEASFELDPPAPERIDNAAWQIARAERTKATIYQTEFDGTEKDRPAEVRQQPPEEMAKVAEKIAASWPHKEK